MWEKPTHLSAIATARPIRVAYLIDLGDCPTQLLDSIFAECYGRWAGRRSLLVPATPDGIDQRYDEWLWYFDPDIIYSFVPLADHVIAAVHERFAPAFLRLHQERGLRREEPPRYAIELPIAGLSSLSVLPAYAARSRGFPSRGSKVEILDKFRDRSNASFVQENFGFLKTSLGNAAHAATLHPELFTCVTLISSEAFKNPHYGKDVNADYVMDEDGILDRLGEDNGPLTMAQLSEFFAPYLNSGHNGPQGLTIVVGDEPADRLLFWNNHHSYETSRSGSITGLRLPTDRLADANYLARIRRIIERRGVIDYQGRTDSITLRSISLDKGVLNDAAEKLREAGGYLHVRVVKDEDHAACIPTFRYPESVGFTRGGIFSEPEGRVTTEFQGSRVVIPRAVPWHISEDFPPPGIRGGNWMVDVSVDRLKDHCRYVNKRHVWALPRRIRIERAFELERESEDRHDYHGKFIRPMRLGSLGIALNTEVTHVAISVPDDLDAIRAGICNDYEWLRFDQSRDEAPHGQTRFRYTNVSDKGRYLLGVLQLFDSLPDAFEVLMHGYWRDVLKYLGAEPVGDDPRLRSEFIKTLRKRLRQPKGPLQIEEPEEMERLARLALHFGRMVRREPRYVDYTWLKAEWQKLVENELRAYPAEGEEDEAYWEDERRLTRSIQYVCQSELLFQGMEWQCPTCFNRNWVSIESLGRTLECEVCRRSDAAPVSGDWHFRLNPFLIEAYQQHGTEVLIWALRQIWDRSDRSFYFAPSLRLWLQFPRNKESCNAEVDAIAVADGKLYMVEATTETRLTNGEIGKLALAAEHIRPDVLFVACGAAGKKEQITARLQTEVPAEVIVEVMTFDPERLERRPWLHG